MTPNRRMCRRTYSNSFTNTTIFQTPTILDPYPMQKLYSPARRKRCIVCCLLAPSLFSRQTGTSRFSRQTDRHFPFQHTDIKTDASHFSRQTDRHFPFQQTDRQAYTSRFSRHTDRHFPFQKTYMQTLPVSADRHFPFQQTYRQTLLVSADIHTDTSRFSRQTLPVSADRQADRHFLFQQTYRQTAGHVSAALLLLLLHDSDRFLRPSRPVLFRPVPSRPSRVVLKRWYHRRCCT